MDASSFNFRPRRIPCRTRNLLDLEQLAFNFAAMGDYEKNE